MSFSERIPHPRIAIIGAGSWSQSHHGPALSAHPDATIAAIVDPELENARRLAEKVDALAVYSSVDELIRAGIADAAIVATPHTTHHSLASTLMANGFHVLVEKPISTTAADAFDLVALSETNSLHFAVGYTYQYTLAASAVREWVTTRLGALVQVVVEFSSRAGALYATTSRSDDLSAYSANNGSGQGNTQLTHAMAALLWTTGEQVDEVAAITSNRGLDVDVDDAVVFRLRGGASGTAASTGTVDASVPMRHHIRYLGEYGTIDYDLLSATARLTLDSGEERSIAPHHLQPAYPGGEPARAFVDLLAGVGPNLAPARPAAATVAFTEAMYRSSAERAFVSVRQLP